MENHTREKSLTIRRSVYADVTKVPHFPVELSYAGHRVEIEDVYFDDPEKFIVHLQSLEATRKGEALLDGGFRIKFWFRATSRGGMIITFRAEEREPSFPGRYFLEGSFEIDGEQVGGMVRSFKRLIKDGTPLTI